MAYEDWCELMSTIKVTDKRKSASAQIKKITSARADSLSDIDESARIPRKKKARAGVLHSKKPHKKSHKNHGIQRYCMLCKKTGIPD